MRCHPIRLLKTCKLKNLLTIYLLSTLLWIIQSTILYTTTPFNNHKSHSNTFIPTTLHNKTIQFITAHPDDEVMFFAPSIIELLKPQYGNVVKLVCFSQGNDVGLGSIRHNELITALRILGVENSNFEILNDEDRFKDSMSLTWNSEDILQFIHKDTDVIITFDHHGVSSHPNHISLYHGALQWLKRGNEHAAVYALKSWPITEKYSFTLSTNLQLLKLHFINFITVHFPQHQHTFKDTTPTDNNDNNTEKVMIFSNLYDTLLGLTAMIHGHYSQMVWFRWIWITFSKYGNCNELVRVV